MKNKRHRAEEIITILRAAETSEQPLAEFCRAHSISAETFYRWRRRRRFQGLEVPAAKQLRDLSGENNRLKQLLAERDLEVAALKALVQKNGNGRPAPGGGAGLASGRAVGAAQLRAGRAEPLGAALRAAGAG